MSIDPNKQEGRKRRTVKAPANFTGVLAEPIKSPPLPARSTILTSKTGDPDGDNKAALWQWACDCQDVTAAAAREKLEELFKHYGLDPQVPLQPTDPWHQLALRLAFQFVPGFQMTDPRSMAGRKKTTGSDSEQADLVLAVRSELVRPGHSAPRSERGACAILANRPRWKKLGSGETLHKRYMEAKRNPLIRVIDYMAGRWPDDPEAAEMAENALRAIAAEGGKR